MYTALHMCIVCSVMHMCVFECVDHKAYAVWRLEMGYHAWELHALLIALQAFCAPSSRMLMFNSAVLCLARVSPEGGGSTPAGVGSGASSC